MVRTNLPAGLSCKKFCIKCLCPFSWELGFEAKLESGIKKDDLLAAETDRWAEATQSHVVVFCFCCWGGACWTDSTLVIFVSFVLLCLVLLPKLSRNKEGKRE